MKYTMEQVIPIVEELTGRFTGLESTSVSYERARALMEAVLYTLEQGTETQSNARDNIRDNIRDNAGDIVKPEYEATPWETYHRGQDVLKQKVKTAISEYNGMIGNFLSYGSENYRSTVERGIPGFFRRYDLLFEPQENVITYDYPVLADLTKLRGADRVLSYIRCIRAEQDFLKRLPKGYVEDSMKHYDPHYEKGLDNLCGIVMERLLKQCCGTTGERLEEVEDKLEIHEEWIRYYLNFGLNDWKTRSR